jgi:hypothetical protein
MVGLVSVEFAVLLGEMVLRRLTNFSDEWNVAKMICSMSLEQWCSEKAHPAAPICKIAFHFYQVVSNS